MRGPNTLKLIVISFEKKNPILGHQDRVYQLE